MNRRKSFSRRKSSNKTGRSSSSRVAERRRSSKRVHRPSMIGQLSLNEIKDLSNNDGSSKTNRTSHTQTKLNILKGAMLQLSKSSYGTQVDGDPKTSIHISLSTVKIKNILNNGGGISFEEPISVDVNTTMDRYRCSSVNSLAAPTKHADMLIVDKKTHCVHRYVCNTIKFLNVPLDALEMNKPRDDNDIHEKNNRRNSTKNEDEDEDGNAYSKEGNNVEEEWNSRPNIIKFDNRARDAKMQKIQSISKSNKFVYVRCFKNILHHDDKLYPENIPIILGSNKDQRPFIYRKCHVVKFNSIKGHPHNPDKKGLAVVTFVGVEHFTHCGLVGRKNSSLDVDENKECIRYTDYGTTSSLSDSDSIESKVDRASGGSSSSSSSSNNNGNSGNSTRRSSNPGQGVSIDQIALHKIVLSEDLKISQQKIIKSIKTNGFLPNQFTNPTCCTFLSSGTFMILDADAVDPGCSPRVQVFNGTTKMCQKIISNSTLETIKAKTLMKRMYQQDDNSNGDGDISSSGSSSSSNSSSSSSSSSNSKTDKNKNDEKNMEKQKQNRASHHSSKNGSLLFRTEVGLLLGDRPVPKNIIGCGEIRKKDNVKKWVNGVMIDLPMPFVKKNETKVSSHTSIPFGSEFLIDSRIGLDNTLQKTTFVLQKLNKKNNLKQQDENNFHGHVSNWSIGYSELLEWSFEKKIPSWYLHDEERLWYDMTEEERFNNGDQSINLPIPVMCIKIYLIPPIEERKNMKKIMNGMRNMEEESKKRGLVRGREKNEEKILEEKMEEKMEEKESNQGNLMKQKSLLELPGIIQDDSLEYLKNKEKFKIRILWVNVPTFNQMYSTFDIFGVNGSETKINEIKKEISNKIEINEKYLRLYYDNWQLENNRELNWYGIPKHSDGKRVRRVLPVLKLVSFKPREYIFFKDGSGLWREIFDKEQKEENKKNESSKNYESKKAKDKIDDGGGGVNDYDDIVKNNFYYSTNHVRFYYGRKCFPSKKRKDRLDAEKQENDQNKLPASALPASALSASLNFPWYSKSVPLQIRKQIRPKMKYRARFRIWHKHVNVKNNVISNGSNVNVGRGRNLKTGIFSGSFSSDDMNVGYTKRLGKYAPPKVENIFLSLGHKILSGTCRALCFMFIIF
jgi:hypothetical protein